MICVIDAEFKQQFSLGSSPFDEVMQLHGEVYRELEGRRTQRIQNYFIKQHFGVGWKEIFKNLLQLRWPILGAKNEWLAISQLKNLNIAVQEVVGYGSRGVNPATQQSFLITRQLPESISLEDFCKNWKTQKPAFKLKLGLLKEVARITRVMHENGMNHRDCYLCHFLFAQSTNILYLIDLHRAQIRKRTPQRWIVKDLSGLYFSSKDSGLTQRDLFRFMKYYRAKPLRELLNQEENFWQKVKKRGDQLYQKHKHN